MSIIRLFFNLFSFKYNFLMVDDMPPTFFDENGALHAADRLIPLFAHSRKARLQ